MCIWLCIYCVDYCTAAMNSNCLKSIFCSFAYIFRGMDFCVYLCLFKFFPVLQSGHAYSAGSSLAEVSDQPMIKEAFQHQAACEP